MACRVEVLGRKESRFFEMIEESLVEVNIGQNHLGFGEQTLIVEVIEYLEERGA